ncbi:bifunctional 4-hydroxy-3-methylbut-2-enyl diphosphate reductase/30S ribosomal protein S1 [Desulfurispora thermophila]|uniref:bifunctional 4-hydroxy-3-methylbut-2-enyl diphosphate reductase/30S ribosomal protein S1 n=1 Tax=Desulfurispora thermophila TaxID=265470 RepID=UPI00036900BF|nr:bifunctional 4-hydroxy-3-methylbut-2-enyl diphosphate reductase/30S ribosomal protein S1 [Desulfurispora thermophila]
MQITRADKAGFCFGVKRAIELATGAARQNSGPVYTYGQLIHNQQEVARLAGQGIHAVDSLDQVPEGSLLIIRSHGVGPEVLTAAAARKITVLDATCPFVSNVQKKAREMAQQGYQVIVVGNASHPEVQGIVAWTGHQALVVADAEQIRAIQPAARVGVVAQTTIAQQNLAAVVAALVPVVRELKLANTVCQATRERQQAAEQLASRVDLMLVVGGRNSANTTKLATVCAQTGTETHHVETAAELDRAWFTGKRTVGITAGASTPDWLIQEVETRVKELVEMTGSEEVMVNEIPTSTATQESTAETTPEENMKEAMDVKTVHYGEIIPGTVVQIRHDEVLVDIGAKSEGFIPLKELSCYEVNSPQDVVSVGDVIDVFVMRSEDSEGRVMLSKQRADAEKAWAKLQENLQTGETVTGIVREVVKGGLLVDIGVRAFLPASLVERGYVEDLSKYLGMEIQARVIEVNKARKKVVLSRKAVLEEEYARKRQELLDSLQEGAVVRGTVRRLTSFGAFVDLGGVDGLLHVSEMAWYRVGHPSEVVNVGDEIEVKVLKVDRENEKISLGLKQVLPNPWDNVAEKYPPGSIVKAKVMRLASFGAFVQLEPGVEGLVHISHLSTRHVEKPEDVVQEGEEVNVKVLDVNPEEKRIRLSIREVVREQEKRQPAREAQAGKQAESQVEQPAEQAEQGNVTIGEIVGDIFEGNKE